MGHSIPSAALRTGLRPYDDRLPCYRAWCRLVFEEGSTKKFAIVFESGCETQAHTNGLRRCGLGAMHADVSAGDKPIEVMAIELKHEP